MNFLIIVTLLGTGTTPEKAALGRGLGLGCLAGTLSAGVVWLYKDPADSTIKVPLTASAIGLGCGLAFAGYEYTNILMYGEEETYEVDRPARVEGHWEGDRWVETYEPGGTKTYGTMTEKSIPYFCLGYSLAITPFIIAAFLLF
ncbi:MAG: hypothetical protein ACP5QG_09220 [candidate division WOR-3 bacterium]